MTQRSGRPSASPTARISALARVAGRLSAALALALALAAAMPALAGAATTVFNPVADSYVSSSSPNTNYGTSTHLRAQGSSPTYRSYLRFDVQGLSDQVTGAVLRLSALASQAVDVRGVSDSSWGETTIKYSNAPPVGDVAATSGSVLSGRWIGIDVTSLIQGNGTVSMALTSPTTSSTLRDFSSRNASGKAPQLLVQTASPGDNLVAAAGDIACSTSDSSYNGGAGTTTACQQRATSDLLAGLSLNAVLPLGDNQYESGALSQFQTVYDPTWGRFNAISHPVVGNHEYVTTGASGYFDYFNGVGSSTGPAGDRGKGYYSYDLGNWHLIALNSNCTKVAGGCGTGSAQEQWLATDLAAHPSSCILAYYHHPNFTSGKVATTATPAFWQDLYAAGADLIVNAHEPFYERFARQDPIGIADPNTGIREIVAATGGRYHYSIGTVAANSGDRDNKTFGVLLLTLRSDGYDWRFVPAAGGKFTDIGSDSCTGSTVDTEPPATPRSPTAKAQSSSSVLVKWTASIDNDGVASYQILRDGTPIGTSTTPSYTDISVLPGTTYTYRVVAYDAVGNASPSSVAATVTTPTG